MHLAHQLDMNVTCSRDPIQKEEEAEKEEQIEQPR